MIRRKREPELRKEHTLERKGLGDFLESVTLKLGLEAEQGKASSEDERGVGAPKGEATICLESRLHSGRTWN